MVATAPADYERAEMQCEMKGLHLATITSEGENDFVYSICKPGRHTWIGLSDAKKKGKYEWVTGECTDYRKFSKYVDHGSGGQERYIGFWEYPTCHKQWNDFKNNHTISGVSDKDQGYI